MDIRKANCIRLGCMGLTGLFYASAAEAADPPAMTATSSELDEVVVVAQRRTERLQDVPLSVTALNSSDLQARGLNGTQELTAIVPSLNISGNGSSAIIFLRGVGTNDGNPNSEPSVATYVDGVYIAAPFSALFKFNNIERVEVLKGPQGTLFGRNATGGVIQIITRDPQQQAHVEASAGYGNYDKSTASLYVTGGGGMVAADLAVLYENQGNGFGQNRFNGRDVYFEARDNISLRSKLLLTPTDSTEIRLSADYSRSHFDNIVAFQLARGAIGAGGVPNPVTGFNTNTDLQPDQRGHQYGFSGKINQDIGNIKFLSITSYRSVFGDFTIDLDATPQRIAASATSPQSIKTFSQEFQLISGDNSAIDWLLGAFYFDHSADYHNNRILTPTSFFERNATQKVKSGSVFGQATAEIVSKLKLTAGLRYTDEKIRLVDAFRLFEGGAITQFPSQKQTTKKLTWRLALDYKLNEAAMAYISYNRGLKSGGYSITGANLPGFGPEILDAYEVGIKSELFGRRLRLNASAYYYDYKDIQVNSNANVVGAGTFTQNAASATIKGLDVDVRAVLARGLTLSAAIGYLDSKYNRFPGFPAVGPNAGATRIIDAGGNKLAFAPKFTGSVSLDYIIDSSMGEFRPNITVARNSGYFVTAENRAAQPSYTRVNANLGWKSSNGSYGIRIWGTNLTSAKYYMAIIPTALGDVQSRAAPRTYGVTTSLNF